jgi:hypothetical protein
LGRPTPGWSGFWSGRAASSPSMPRAVGGLSRSRSSLRDPISSWQSRTQSTRFAPHHPGRSRPRPGGGSSRGPAARLRPDQHRAGARSSGGWSRIRRGRRWSSCQLVWDGVGPARSAPPTKRAPVFGGAVPGAFGDATRGDEDMTGLVAVGHWTLRLLRNGLPWPLDPGKPCRDIASASLSIGRSRMECRNPAAMDGTTTTAEGPAKQQGELPRVSLSPDHPRPRVPPMSRCRSRCRASRQP